MFEAARTILKQLFLKPATNKFPAKYAPASTIQFLEGVTKGELKMIPPVPVPPDFRGKIAYDKDKCNGCGLCVPICPTRAIEYVSEDVPNKERKLKIFISRCCFCSQCVEICPTKALSMTGEFLLSAYDKYADELIVTE